MKILMVCLGNICRSPMADGLLRKKVNDEDLSVVVDSAGTSSYHIGEAPDNRMRETAKKLGCPIDELRARQFTVADFDQFDSIYAMDRSNYNNILKLSRTEADAQKVKLILNELYPGENREVPDPYFGGEQGFVEVFNMLDQATDVIINKLKNDR
ncbi:MAG: low molecular weight phosphotyrosine protein phosphatase [Crocinitomicaceae bacterium]|nr:low molecular weight phosphotyrosine protein phosphatase [Crocinitomicaceae bacterium]